MITDSLKYLENKASWLHCLRHINFRSYNLDYLKVTTGLKDKMDPDKEMIVVQALCALLLCLADKKLYSIKAIFKKDNMKNTISWSSTQHM